jgi:putative ABC transport system permease protein
VIALPVEGLLTDLRGSLKRWMRRPGLAFIAVMTLGLGIAAATAQYSIARTILFRPLPWPDAERLVTVFAVRPGEPASGSATTRLDLAWTDWMNLRALDYFDEVAMWHVTRYAFGDARAEIVPVMYASSSFFSLLGVQPVTGRFFTKDDDETDTNAVIISYEAWQARFGGRPGVIGETVLLGHRSQQGRQEPYTIAGVLPRSFQFDGEAPEFVLPAGTFSIFWRDPGRQLLRILARLQPGLSPETAAVALEPILRTGHIGTPRSAGVAGLYADWTRRTRGPLLLLSAGSALLLFVSCASVSGLLLGEGRARRREVAVRVALGADPRRIRRQLFLDHVVLGLAGAIAGLLMSAWLTGALIAVIPPHLSGPIAPNVDVPLILFAAVAAVVTAVMSGLAPVLLLAATTPLSLMAGGDQAGGGWRRFPQRAMVVVQVGISLGLIVAAVLFGETVYRLTAVPLGFEPNNLAVISTTVTRRTDLTWPADSGTLDAHGLEGLATRQALQGRLVHTQGLIDRLLALPQVTAVAGVSEGPFGGMTRDIDIRLEGRADERNERVSQLIVTGDFFRALGVQIVSGRAFEPTDAWQRVAVVSNQFARVYFGGDAVGRHFSIAGSSLAPYKVIGVVSDVRTGRLAGAPAPLYYSQGGFTSHVLVRTSTAPEALLPAIRRAIADYDPQVVVTSSTTAERELAESVGQERLRAALSSLWGGAALLLAVIGLYALSARQVMDRRYELGLRLALGASSRSIRRLVLLEMASTVGLGIVVGVPVALVLGHVLRAHLFGVSIASPHVFAAAAGVMAVAAFAATLLPARRATRVDPMITLRE